MEGVGEPEAVSCAALNLTRWLLSKLDTQRLPAESKTGKEGEVRSVLSVIVTAGVMGPEAAANCACDISCMASPIVDDPEVDVRIEGAANANSQGSSVGERSRWRGMWVNRQIRQLSWTELQYSVVKRAYPHRPARGECKTGRIRQGSGPADQLDLVWCAADR